MIEKSRDEETPEEETPEAEVPATGEAAGEATPEVEDEAAPDAVADAPAEGEAPEEAALESEAADEADADAPAKKPRRRRSRKKDEEPAEEAAPERKTTPAPRSRDGAVAVRAHAKYVRTSARKARLVGDHVRGKSVDEARAILALSPRAVARDWSKVLESAIANAEHNHELVGDDLRLAEVFADEGPTLKRFRPRAMGRATRIRKRTSHLTITLSPKE